MLSEPGAVASALVPVMPRNLTVVEGLCVSDQPVFMVLEGTNTDHMVVPDLVFIIVEGVTSPLAGSIPVRLRYGPLTWGSTQILRSEEPPSECSVVFALALWCPPGAIGTVMQAGFHWSSCRSTCGPSQPSHRPLQRELYT